MGKKEHIRVEAEVWVDEVLEELETQELIDELRERGEWPIGGYEEIAIAIVNGDTGHALDLLAEMFNTSIDVEHIKKLAAVRRRT